MKHIESSKVVGGLILATAATAAASVAYFFTKQSVLPKEEDLLKRNDKGCTPLHIACSSADLKEDLGRLLTPKGLTAINWSCDKGWTPLLLATAKGQAMKVKTLLEHGADLFHANVDGYTPLMVASNNGLLELVRMLTSRDEDKEQAWGLFTKSNKAETALFFACVQGHTEIVRLLLVKEKEFRDSYPSNNSESLLESMAFNGATPLHAACDTGNVELVKLLLLHGANVHALDINNSTPLHMAASSESIEVVRLLAVTSNLEAPNSYGSTPLHGAVFQGVLPLARALLESGASVSVHDHDGLLPIHSVCRSSAPNAPDLLELLIQFRSDVNSLDSTGRTPLHMCASKQETGFELAKVLLKHGADVTREDERGWTALHVATSEVGHEATAKILRQYAAEHYSTFLTTFNPDKERSEKVTSRPPRFCNLSREQQQAILEVSPPSIDAIAKFVLSGNAKKVLVLTGAGVSVSAGIPDFRTPSKGLYTSAVGERYGLASGPSMFDVANFFSNPQAFYHMATDVFFPAMLGQVKPTKAHNFIKLLHEKGILLRNYTQNIDALERVSGIPDEALVEVHGSLSEYCCSKCNEDSSLEYVQKCLARNMPPLCACSGLIRPKVVFFGDPLPRRFYEMYIKDCRECDLLIVMGTSLKVYPFASLVNMVGDEVPRLMINLQYAGPFEEEAMASEWNYRDVCLKEEADSGVIKLCDLLGWQL